jgi:hypothetical protein
MDSDFPWPIWIHLLRSAGDQQRIEIDSDGLLTVCWTCRGHFRGPRLMLR